MSPWLSSGRPGLGTVRRPTAAQVRALGQTGGVNMGEKLVEERRRRRAGDPRVTPEGRAILLRLVEGDLMGEFQAALDAVSAEDPMVGGGPETGG